MDVIRAKVRAEKKDYIHNDLSQAATYFCSVVEEKNKQGNRTGIAFDSMACALMIAFAFEANLNFMGNWLLKNGKIASWEESGKLYKKRNKVFTALGMKIEPEQRPLSSMDRMRRLRDTFAHGKPIEIDQEDERVGTESELRKGATIAGEWDDEIRPEVIKECLDDLDDLWKQMIKASGINIMDTMSGGGFTISLIAKVPDVNGS